MKTSFNFAKKNEEFSQPKCKGVKLPARLNRVY